MQVFFDQMLYWSVAFLPFLGGAIAWLAFDAVEIRNIRRRQRDRKAAIRAKNADRLRKPKSVWDQGYRLSEKDFESLEATECTTRRCDCVLDQSPGFDCERN